MRTRLIKKTPKPDPEFWAEAVCIFRIEMERAPDAVQTVDPMSLEAWLARLGGHDNPKVVINRNEYRRFKRGEVPTQELTSYTCGLKDEITTFLACRTYDMADWVKTRLIEEANPAIKGYLGMYLVPQADHLHTTMGPATYRPLAFACGSHEEDMAAWVIDSFHKLPHTIMFDFSGFDMTNSSLSYEVVKMRNKLLGMPATVAKVHDYSSLPALYKGRYANRAKVVDPGTQTGHPGTSIDNSCKNATAVISACILGWAEQHGYRITAPSAPETMEYLDDPDCPVVGRDLFLMVHGDDGIGMMRPDLVEGTLRQLNRSGFVAKCKAGLPLPKIDFCSKALWPVADMTSGGFCFGPLLKLLFKLGVTACNELAGDTREPDWLMKALSFRRGNAIGLLLATNFIPLLHDRIEADLSISKGIDIQRHFFKLGLKEINKPTWVKYDVARRHEPAFDSREWAAARYDVPLWSIDEMATCIRRNASAIPSFDICPAWLVLLPAIAETDSIK